MIDPADVADEARRSVATIAGAIDVASAAIESPEVGPPIALAMALLRSHRDPAVRAAAAVLDLRIGPVYQESIALAGDALDLAVMMIERMANEIDQRDRKLATDIAKTVEAWS